MDATVVGTGQTLAVDTLGRRIMPRRFRPLAEKRRIAQEALQPGVSVAEIARRYGINANLVFVWRRLEQQGLLGRHLGRGEKGLVPVEVTATPALEVVRRPEPPSQSATPGSVRIEFAGGVQLHVTGAIDYVQLERLIGLLRG
jgi:transposase